MKAREIEIYDIELISISKDKKEIVYKVKCSKGTYIRTLCENIAEKLGTVGFMKELNRIRVGEFDINQAIKISDIMNCNSIDSLRWISIEDFFKDKMAVKFEDNKIIKFLNGVKIYENVNDGIYRVYDKNEKFIGIGVAKDGRIKRDIVVI